MTFELKTMTQALIRSVNNRAEMHGNDPVPAVDIAVRVTGQNTLLDLLSPELRPMLYKAADGSQAQEGLPGVDAVSDTPALRSMVLDMPVKLSTQIVGRNLEIDYGTGGKSNVKLSTVSVNEFKVEALDGGSINLDFRIQASGLDEKTLGKLATLIRHDVQLTLTASEEPKQNALEDMQQKVVTFPTAAAKPAA